MSLSKLSVKSLTKFFYQNSRNLSAISMNTMTNVRDQVSEKATDKETFNMSRCRTSSLHRPKHFLEQHNISSISKPVKYKDSTLYTGIDPQAILSNHTYNKATAFTKEERKALGLTGLLPPVVESIEVQMNRAYQQLNRFTVPLSKHIYLSSLRERNQTLFYYLLVEHLEELMPLIYTPTIGQACQEFGLQFRQAEGMYISIEDKKSIRHVLDNWKPNILNEVSIIVVTDGSRILGLGDLGACGMGIPVGKLALYVAAAGFHPATTLPILLDLGTTNEKLRNDEFYLGTRLPRVSDEEYYALTDEFMAAVKDKWPKALIQFEDFSNDHCFSLLEKYREKYLCFNDDIQGTGAVIAAGFLNALKLANLDPKSCRIVFNGAGSSGIGVADQIKRALMLRFNMTETECRNLFYMVDSKGLVTLTRGDKLANFKLPYARTDVTEQLKSLEEVVRTIKPQALVGLSGQGRSFTKQILQHMGEINERPIIFPLSNPTEKAECSFEEAFEATNKRVIFASGSPFDPIKDGNKIYIPSQGNNLYTFPGIGFGAYLSQAKKITDEMITHATIALADFVSKDDLAKGLLYPPLSKVREASVQVAAEIMKQAYKQGLSQLDAQPDDYILFVEKNRYNPQYLNLFN